MLILTNDGTCIAFCCQFRSLVHRGGRFYSFVTLSKTNRGNVLSLQIAGYIIHALDEDFMSLLLGFSCHYHFSRHYVHSSNHATAEYVNTCELPIVSVKCLSRSQFLIKTEPISIELRRCNAISGSKSMT
jgi:hypothetical protein